MNTKFLAGIAFGLCACTTVFSQAQQDSIPSTDAGLPIYPRVKLLTVSYDQSGEADYKVKNTGQTDNEGTIARGRLQVMGKLPIWNKKGFTLSATEIYTREEQSIKESSNPLYTDTERTHNFNNFTTTLNGSYIGKLFNKPLLANASLILGSADFINTEKVSGIISGVLVFQKKPQTRFTLGLALIADPSAQFPAFPIISYWHRFKDPRWELDVLLPTTVKIRRSGVLGGWLSAGTDFSGFGYFLTDVPGTSKTYQNNYSELSLSLAYERIFAKNFMISLQGGYRTTIQNRIFEVYEPSRDAPVEVEIDNAPFLKVGLSYIITNDKVKKEVQRRTK